MIGWLKGTVRARRDPVVIVETTGIGYEVTLSSPATQGAQPGDPIELFVHTHVREDELTLYGFPSLFDRELFRLLTTVNGVGAKSAIAILSALPSDRLVDAIRSADLALLQRTPGIGKKTSERLVMELREKIRVLVPPDTVSAAPHRRDDPMAEDLISALVNLGYKRPLAEAAVARMDLSKAAPFDTMLRETLKLLSR